MIWRLHDLGFHPNTDPLATSDGSPVPAAERLGDDLPRLVREQTFREASVEYLAAPVDWNAVIAASDDRQIERLFLRFSYIASAYVHATGLPTAERLPREIAVPLEKLATAVGRPPILSYASYCLNNWARLDAAKPVALGNIRLLQNFSESGDGKEDEDWFILVHVDIEAGAGAGMQAVNRIGNAVAQNDAAAAEAILTDLSASLAAMNRTMARMPEACRPEVYFRRVRPYIFGFTNVVYEGCADTSPRSYRGETGAQSSIVPTLLMALGIRHKDSLLTTHLADMRTYMPPAHRKFIEGQPSIREFVMKCGEGRLKDLYNECLRGLIAFRAKHFDYAVNYIERRVDNPLGTGGTPFVPWLRKLHDETEEHLLT